jgi:nucleotide-binding universal stress UspA family protein
LSLTAQEASRIAEILTEGEEAGLSMDKLRAVLAAIPHATQADIKQVLETMASEARADAAAYEEAAKVAERLGRMVERASVLSGKPDMNTGEAIAYLAQRAQSGDEEATALLKALDDPFLGG